MTDEKVDEPEGNYFRKTNSNFDFISSGCTLLDCVLGGGYPLGRFVNIVGDKSTGKTLLAIEATANFAQTYPTGDIWYNEVEAAFNPAFAEQLGLPLDRVEFVEDCYTVEDVFEHLTHLIQDRAKSNITTPGLYILDSLDALSDRAEMDREIDKGSFGANKAKQMSQLFRRLTKKIDQSNICVMIISQVRDNIGVMFGKKHVRSGGRALDFYATQVLWLSQTKTITKTKHGITRTTGIYVKAKCEKNKVSLPYRECVFPLVFGYGIANTRACVEWLESVKKLGSLDIEDADAEGKPRDSKSILKDLDKLDNQEFVDRSVEIADQTQRVWLGIEDEFLPKRRKYSYG